MSTNATNANGDDEQLTNHIPNALRSRDQWCCWLIKESEGEEKESDISDRAPIQPTTEERPNHSEPSTLDDFETAKTLSDAPATDREGLGFVLTEGDSIVSIRLDEAVSEDGPEEWAEEIIQRLDTYAEYGPDMENIYLFLRGSCPEGRSWRNGVEVREVGIRPVTGNRLSEATATVEECQDALESIHQEYVAEEDADSDETNAAEAGENDALANVRKIVTEEFDPQMWDVTEAALSSQATLLLSGPRHCTGLVIVGESGAGKTTVLSFFDELEQLVYRSDHATPASFVSHDASLSEEELREVDLLPRIRHKTLLVRDMSGWFAGDKETIEKRMSVLATLMDGEGYTTDSGSHGERGYKDGDYRFAVLGANTPLAPRAWEAMGHTGNRFVFHERPGSKNPEQAVADVTEGDPYSERVDRCQEAVHEFLKNLWDGHGGYGSVDWDRNPSDEIQDVLSFLTRVVQHSRAPVEQGKAVKEGGHRISAALWDLARGHALLREDDKVDMGDMEVPARVALSTMPKERRPVVRAVLNPDTGESITATELTKRTPYSKPTVLDRMELLDTLGIADCKEVDDRGTKVVERRGVFEWPDSLDFPEF